MAIDGKLIFTGLPNGGKLVFGDAEGGSAPAANVSADAGFDADDLATTGQLLWSANVSRGERHVATVHWEDGDRAGARAQQVWQDAQRLTAQATSRWQDASAIGARAALLWEESQKLSARAAMRWQDGTALRHNAQQAWQEAQRMRAIASARWQDSVAMRHTIRTAWQETIRLRHLAAQRWQDGTPMRREHRHSSGPGIPVRVLAATRWQDAMRPPAGLSKPLDPIVPPVEPCYDPAALGRLVFDTPWVFGDGRLVFVCKRGEVVHPPATIVVPVRSVYMTVNSLALVRVSDGALIKADGFSISLSDDGWTWNWSASVQGRTMAMFSPESGEPVELEVTLNGVAFRLLAEEVGRDRAFKKNDLAVSGRGLAAELDELYAPTLNFSAAGDRTAQQLASEALQLNGVGIGWDLEWGLEDWLVPGGVWSHQGTHISAVKAIAASVGGYVQPHRTAKTLRILHRYPVAPWDWADVTPDIVLPSAPVIVEGIKWASKPGYNRVHVSGQGAGGLGEVTRDGTAGDVSAPMVVDQLITAVEAARQRGRAELSDTGRQALVSLSLPVLSDTGFILPGQFLEYVDGGQTRIGLTRGAALSWDQPRMRQQITVETHEIA